jgi:hypothetical protein
MLDLWEAENYCVTKWLWGCLVRRSSADVDLVIGCLACSMGAANNTYQIMLSKSRQQYSIAIMERENSQAIL